MPGSGSEPGSGNRQNPDYSEVISERFKDYIEKQKPGLKQFYKWGTQDEFDQHLKDPATRGSTMIQQLMYHGCPGEVALSLSLLALYDLVILIDNSLSMRLNDGGSNFETLRAILKAASDVYSFAGTGGLTAVRFLNTTNKYLCVGPGKIQALMNKIVFEGLTNIGTKLRDKVLENHVNTNMRRPLLVIVITDAEIEGEVPGLLKDVILTQAVELEERYGKHGSQGLLPPDVFPENLRRPLHPVLISEAVAYQFAIVGNNGATQGLTQGLGNVIRGNYIDCMRNENRLGDILEDLWGIVPKLLLGAISPYWNSETATLNDTWRNRSDELGPPPPDDEESELEDDGFTLFKPGRDEPNGNDESNINGGAPGEGNPGLNIPLSNQAEVGSSPSGQMNTTIPTQIPDSGRPPTDAQAYQSPPTNSQGNASLPTDSRTNTSPAEDNQHQPQPPRQGGGYISASDPDDPTW